MATGSSTPSRWAGALPWVFLRFLIPVAQVVFAVIAAMFLRANPPVAALATLVTNPITFPFRYLVAYRIGRVFIEAPPVSAQHAATLGQAQFAGALESFSAFWQWMSGWVSRWSWGW